MSTEENWRRQAFENLKGRPKETLAAIALVVGGSLLAAGVDLWFAAGFPAVIFLLYAGFKLLDNRHQLRMAEIDVKKLEQVEGRRTAERAQRALERRRRSNGKP